MTGSALPPPGAPTGRPLRVSSWVSAVFSAAGLLCCTPNAPAEAPRTPTALPAGPERAFRCQTSDGQWLGHESLRGRTSVVFLMATYDLASQEQAKRLEDALHHHTPRINVLGLVLEGPEYAPMMDGFHAAMRLDFPLCLAEARVVDGEAFGRVRQIPMLVVLDRHGRETWRGEGLVEVADLDTVLSRTDERGR